MLKALVIGAGPAGLMAAEVMARAGLEVHVYDAMPSAGRKFLLAGKGGLNLTHSETADVFAGRFGARRAVLEPWLHQFGAQEVRAWALGLGIETFVGTSGRVFPKDMKAAPLLRAWLHRLRQGADGAAPVQFHMRHRWVGWSRTEAAAATDLAVAADAQGAPMNPSASTPPARPAQHVRFESAGAEVLVSADAVVLALGGASWPQLGSTGAWVTTLAAQGVAVAPLLPANCGFDVGVAVGVGLGNPLGAGPGNEAGQATGWSSFFTQKFAGLPFKSVAITVQHRGQVFQRKGEFVATATGVEGSLIYAASALLRDAIAADGQATFYIDLLPDVPAAKVQAEVSHPRGARSLSSHLKSRLHLDGIKMAVLVEVLGKDGLNDAARLAAAIKHLPITVNRARPVAEAISTAGGVPFDALDGALMLQRLPGVFCAGEMLDWEAPTGGYLLTACLSSGRLAGQGVLRYLPGVVRG
jgi:predicted flavoprotein YhiN